MIIVRLARWELITGDQYIVHAGNTNGTSEMKMMLGYECPKYDRRKQGIWNGKKAKTETVGCYLG